MNDEPVETASLDALIADYLDALASGKVPDRAQLLAAHPELAAELRAFFADHDRMTQAAAPVRAAVGDEPPPAEPFPQLFGDYELLAEIGRGGMGVVYKARQLSLNRLVALKRIRAGQLASADEVARFRREAEAAAGLDHPHIVPILEVGEHAGQHYFTMKLIDGGNLSSHLGSYTNARSIAALMIEIAHAVHHAHQRGILHRDLKPGNILLDADGQPLVSDFGLAQPLEKEAKLTHSGAIVGTAEYMAPEQARGEKGLTTAADVYGLGAILYVLLTGQPPFQGDYNWDTLKQVVEDEPRAPRSVKRQVNRELETICLKCLAKQPTQRYGSAEAVAEECESYLAGKPIRARRTRLAEHLWKWAKRRPTLAALLLVTLALAALGGWLSYEWPARRHAEEAAETERNLRAIEAKLSRQRHWSSLWQQAVGERLDGKRWAALETLHKLVDLQRAQPELGDRSLLEAEAIRAIHLPGIRRRAELTFWQPLSAELSADGELLLVLGSRPDSAAEDADHTFGVWVYHVADDRLTLHEKTKIPWRSSPPSGLSWRVLFTGAGAEVAIVPASSPTILYWDPVANRELREETKTDDAVAKLTQREQLPEPWAPGVAWRAQGIEGRPDQKTGAVQFWDARRMVALSTLPDAFLAEKERDPNDHFRAEYSVLSHNGRWFAVRGKRDRSAVLVWDTLHGKVADLVGNPIDNPAPVCFRPDDRVLAIHCARSEACVELWDLETRQRLAVVPQPGGEYKRTDWSSQGPPLRWSAQGNRFIALAEAKHNRHAIAVYDFALASPGYAADDVVHALHFSSAGTQLAARGSVWTVGGPAEQRFLRPAFRSTGDLVCLGTDGTVRQVHIPQPRIDLHWQRHGTTEPIKIVEVAPQPREWLLPRPRYRQTISMFEMRDVLFRQHLAQRFIYPEPDLHRKDREIVAAAVQCGRLYWGLGQPLGLLPELALQSVDTVKDIAYREIDADRVAVRGFGLAPDGKHACVLYQALTRSEHHSLLGQLEVWDLSSSPARLAWKLPFYRSEIGQEAWLDVQLDDSWWRDARRFQEIAVQPLPFTRDGRFFAYGGRLYDTAGWQSSVSIWVQWTGQLPGGKLPSTNRDDWGQVPYGLSGTHNPNLVSWTLGVSGHRVFSADGHVAATGCSNGEIFVQPNLPGDRARLLKASKLHKPNFPPTEEVMQLWTPWLNWDGDRAYDRDGELALVRLQGHRASVHALAFSHDRSLLVAADSSRTLCLWDMKSYRRLLTWQGPEAEITALAFHPDGKLLVAAAKDGSLKVWNMQWLQQQLNSIGLGW